MRELQENCVWFGGKNSQTEKYEYPEKYAPDFSQQRSLRKNF